MMKFYYKLISSIMILALLLPMSVYASDSVKDKYPVFTDTSSMSDEIFFGVWDEAREVWKTKGKLNYEAFPELAETERFVKLGSYDAAKEALFDYYKNREGFGRQEPYSAVDDRMVYLTLHDMYNFQEQYIASAIIEGSEYQCYEIELSNIVNGAPDIAKGTFMIAAADKSMDIVGISSKEGPAELRPILRFYRKNGTIYELPVIRDSYTRAYNNEVSYETENYGKETELLVKDDFHETTSGLYSPFGANTRETYIQFDSSKILSNEDINGATLVFHARLLPEDGCELEGTTKEIMIFNSYNKTWKEYKGDTTTGPVLTWKDISHTHYSYNGLPGGFNWTKPDGAHSQWMFYNSRFFQVSSMINSYLKTSDENYIYKAIEFVLDFINDGYAGLPNNDIEPGNRSLVLPIAIQYFMDSSFMNPDALTAMLKYMWEEAEYLRMDSSYIHPENNRGLWHTAGFHRIASYYPEFTNCPEWWEVIDKRLDDSIKLLVKEDGCFVEATNSYPKTVAEFLYEIYENCILTGREIPELLLPRLRDLAKYIMYVSYPTGTPNFWGEGGPGNMRSFVKQVGELLEDEELIFFGTKGSDGVEPANTTKVFDYLKVVTSRTDWSTEAYMLWMNAKNGSNHNHKDSLHLTLYAKDQEVLKDTGMTSYDGSHPHFQWQRHTTRSHNTIEIDEIAQRGSATINDEENGESFIQVDTNARTDKITAWTDATKNFRHFRDVTFLKDLKLVIVSDMVQPSDGFEHKYTQNWHSQPFCNAEIDSVTKVGSTHIGEGSNIIIAQSRPEDTVATLEHGYDVYPADTEYFCYTQNKAGNVAYDTVLLPVEEGVDMDLVVENMKTDADPTIASAMQISMFKNDEPRKNVIYYQSRGDNVATHTFGDYSANAETSVMTFDVDGMMETLDVFGAKELKKDGQIIFKSEDEITDLSVNFNGSALELYSSDDKIKQTAFQIAVPKSVKKVTLNGRAVGYIYANNQVYVNADNLENVLLSDGIVYSSEISTADGSYTVTVKIPAETSVISGSFTLPTCTADDEDIKISFVDNMVLSRAAQIIVSDHENATFYKKNGGSDTLITTEKNSITQAQADEMSSSDTVLVRGRRDLEAWTKSLSEFVVGPNTKKVVLSSGGSGSGSSPMASLVGSAVATKSPEPDNSSGDINGNTTKKGFEDIIGHWAETEILEMVEKGVVRGVDESTFAPEAKLTRAAFASLLARTLGLEEVVSDEFADVSVDAWYAGTVGAAAKNGLILGDNGLFMPDANITRQEMAVMIARACRLAGIELPEMEQLEYKDASLCADWAVENIAQMTTLNLLKGVEDNAFAPTETATRAQAAVIIYRFINMIGVND